MLVSEIVSLEKIRDIFPPITYKYRDWDNPYHKTILTRQEVFFSPPAEFWKMGDEHDCRFPIEWDFTYEAARPALDMYFPGDKSKLTPSDYERLLKQKHYNNVGTEQARENHINTYYTLATRHLGVLSITGRNENSKIWRSQYAMDFAGFCVGIDFKDCIHELSDAHIGGGEIAYVPRSHPKISYAAPSTHSEEEVMSLHMQLVHTKYLDFDFEEEYRLTKRFYLHPFHQEVLPADRLFTVPKRCFKSVTFGYKMPQSSIDEIFQVCVDQGLEVKYSIASLSNSGMVNLKSI